ncbi:MAG: hypothetical protein LBU13_06175, partial [Synergistaceae bacterium]|nr:hypothetical protein [Synergistaceae bacterium]
MPSKNRRRGSMKLSSPAKAVIFFLILALLSVSGSANAVEFDIKDGPVIIDQDGYHVITQSEPIANTITVSANVSADITLSGVSVDVSKTQNAIAFDIAANATVTLRLAEGTTNTLKSGSNKAGLHVPSDATLTIEGPGELVAVGGDGGAGIGSSYTNTSTYVTAGSIMIKGGTVTATCNGNYGAGIGGGRNGNYSTITIEGGAVTATGAIFGGSGIGGGYNGKAVEGGNITITGGSVTAVAGGSNAVSAYAAAIGGGHNSSGGKITITGGAVTALPGKYTRSNSPESSRIGVGI